MGFLHLFIVAILLSCPSLEAARWRIHSAQKRSNFQLEWRQFIQEKKMDTTLIGHPHHFIKEIRCLDEFGKKQAHRQRAAIFDMDCNSRWTPYQDNGVKLNNGTNMSASLIKFSAENEPLIDHFIASQAPHVKTMHLFWQMIWEKQIDQVVMLTEMQEGSKDLCPRYWPEKVRGMIQFKNGLSVTLVKEDFLLSKFSEKIQVSTLELNFKGKKKILKHYWYRNWVDGRIPTQPRNLLTLMNRVNQEKVDRNSKVPILVHCHAGVGRTGVFIIIYHLLQKNAVGNSPLSLFECVAHLRWQRPYMVSNPLQYQFCYLFLRSLGVSV